MTDPKLRPMSEEEIATTRLAMRQFANGPDPGTLGNPDRLRRPERDAEIERYRSDAYTMQLATARAEITRLREALTKLRDCDWVISLPDRMDAVRDIARAALAKEK